MATGGNVIALRVEVLKCLSRKSFIEVELDIGTRPEFPLPRDVIPIDRAEIRVVSAPAPDDELLDGSWDGTGFWQCAYEGDWIRVEALAASLNKDPGVLSVKVSP